ncbi:MAG: sigma-70 family RNA polymerase sigma factor [Bacteroidota bacterium]|nr:sigma-70 family RNA polymerase sigma factor [Bacteroidota bacterium]
MTSAELHFETIYARYSHSVYRVCMGYINDPVQAKDLMQETFIAVWKNLSSFREESRISTWIFRIATNICLRAIENSRKVRLEELPFDLPDSGEETVENQLNFLYQCISELDEADRIIISLVLEDLPQQEIADIVGLSHSNIRVKIHRIKEKLSAQFKDHGKFE